MARIWNITDHPKTARKSSVLMVLGRSIRPGRSITVPDDRLAKAHKVHRSVAAGKLFIGPKPPPDYLVAKKPKKAELAAGVARSHGAPDLKQIAEEAPGKLAKVLGETVEAKEEASAELKPATQEATPDEAPAEDTPSDDEGKGSKKRGRRGRG